LERGAQLVPDCEHEVHARLPAHLVDRLNPASPADPEPFGSGDATPPIGVQIGQTLHAFALRTQYSF
jgi:hypothetical protein